MGIIERVKWAYDHIFLPYLLPLAEYLPNAMHCSDHPQGVSYGCVASRLSVRSQLCCGRFLDNEGGNLEKEGSAKGGNELDKLNDIPDTAC